MTGRGGQGDVVLVVDDNDLDRSVVAQMLGGHVVREAGSGAAGLALVSQEKIDLVLLDVLMPEMDGLETCRRMKALRPDQFLPIILLTSLIDRDDRNDGLQAGADEFLTKPVDARELRLRVRNLLRIRGQEQHLRRVQDAKDDMVMTLVHDVRSPLTGQSVLLELALERLSAGADPMLRSDLQSCLNSCYEISSRLEEMLRVRLMEEDQIKVERHPALLSAVLERSAASLDGLARKRHVAVKVTSQGQASSSVDERLVQRAIENLLSNAIKHSSPYGEVAVSLRNDGDQIEIEVADEGPGIPEQLRSGLFEKFGSVEAESGLGRQGVGLGLYLVKLVAQGHGGTVTAHARAGGGALFRMVLPAAPAMQQAVGV